VEAGGQTRSAARQRVGGGDENYSASSDDSSKMKCLGCRGVGRAGRFWVSGTKLYLCWLTDKYTDLRSSVTGTFLSFSTEEYISVIFPGSEEDTTTTEYICSIGQAGYLLVSTCLRQMTPLGHV
jgi:hypothetical protein